MAKQQPQNLTKYYWMGFGGAIVVLAIVGSIYFMLGSSRNVPSNFDESELPQLPSEEESETEVPQLPDSNTGEEIQASGTSGDTAGGSAESAFAGTWRVYSERLFYDEGGGGTTLSASSGTAVTQTLSLKSDGTYSYGDSKGTWSVSSVTDADWKSWGIESYGPTRKITLAGWNKGTASGPVEEESGTVNFLWALYKTGPPTTSKPGTVHMKFGH